MYKQPYLADHLASWDLRNDLTVDDDLGRSRFDDVGKVLSSSLAEEFGAFIDVGGVDDALEVFQLLAIATRKEWCGVKPFEF